MAVGLVVPAAGRGSRFGSPENKIWADLGGRPLLEWTLAAFQAHPRIDVIVLVGAADELERLRGVAASCSKVHAVVAGGASRQESVGNGLAALPADCDLVLVHDAARPCVSQALITRVIEAVERYGAAIPGLPLSDTVKRADKHALIRETVPREGLWTAQTPQGARLADLRAAYQALGLQVAAMTDEASIMEAFGFPVRLVMGEESNLKVTRPDDLARAGAALRGDDRVTGWQGDRVTVSRVESQESKETGSEGDPTTLRPDDLTTPPPMPDVRRPTPDAVVHTGLGYDVHAFAEGRELWLGGVRIPHARGLAGHSDADVLLHAVCDALLGAAAMGDIGVLFPDTDSAHKDRPSIEFIHEVRRRLVEAGWRIVNVDVTLLAEEPRIGPYRPQMTAVLADGLALAPTQINVKATTSEKMGFVGRREGIACWAVATLTRLSAGEERT